MRHGAPCRLLDLKTGRRSQVCSCFSSPSSHAVLWVTEVSSRGWSWFISSWFSWQGWGSQSSPLWAILLGNLVSWDCVCHGVVPGLGDSLSYERVLLTSHGQSCRRPQKANFSSTLRREGPGLLNSFSSLCFCCFQPDPLYHYLKNFKCFSSFKIEVYHV